MADIYSCFAELARMETRGTDYDIDIQHQPKSTAVVVAPHGGGIEPGTCKIAKSISGDELSFYCFRGLKTERNERLHITSHHFDEPECLALLAQHSIVLSIHGCDQAGERIFLGGLDRSLTVRLSDALCGIGIAVETDGHPYPATNPSNICNRGARRVGAQIELTRQFRKSQSLPAFVECVRHVLKGPHGSQNNSH